MQEKLIKTYFLFFNGYQHFVNIYKIAYLCEPLSLHTRYIFIRLT